MRYTGYLALPLCMLLAIGLCSCEQQDDPAETAAPTAFDPAVDGIAVAPLTTLDEDAAREIIKNKDALLAGEEIVPALSEEVVVVESPTVTPTTPAGGPGMMPSAPGTTPPAGPGMGPAPSSPTAGTPKPATPARRPGFGGGFGGGMGGMDPNAI